MECRPIKISVPGQKSPVSGILHKPKNARALLVLAHGAGAGMNHSGMVALSDALVSRDVATLRFQFPYRERGSGRPDSPNVAMETVAAAVRYAAKALPKLPLFAGGRSYGGRMTTNAVARDLIPEVQGIICFAFPLHPPKKPGISRAEHLAEVKIPILFVQGTRDALCDLKLMKKVMAPRRFKLHVIDGADHSFSVLKSSGRTDEEALSEIAQVSIAFCEKTSR